MAKEEVEMFLATFWSQDAGALQGRNWDRLTHSDHVFRLDL
jgi:hypothetical protein